MKSILPMISFMDCAFGVVLKYHHHPQDYLDFSSKIQGFYNFAFDIQVYDLFGIKICEGCKVCIPIHYFLLGGCPIVLAPIVEKTIFSLLYYFCSLVKGQLTIFMWVCFLSVDNSTWKQLSLSLVLLSLKLKLSFKTKVTNVFNSLILANLIRYPDRRGFLLLLHFILC